MVSNIVNLGFSVSRILEYHLNILSKLSFATLLLSAKSYPSKVTLPSVSFVIEPISPSSSLSDPLSPT